MYVLQVQRLIAQPHTTCTYAHMLALTMHARTHTHTHTHTHMHTHYTHTHFIATHYTHK